MTKVFYLRLSLLLLALSVIVIGPVIAQTVSAPDRILEVQRRLSVLGYNPGPPDGMPGPRTQGAIERFQQDNGLSVTGRLDALTIERLLPDLILYTQVFDPFHYSHPVTGNLTGPGVEIVQTACRFAQLNCVLRLGEGSWQETQEKVRRGEGDGLFLIGWNARRAEYLVRTDEVLGTEYGFFVHDEDPLEYQGPESLDGYRIGVYGRSNTSITLDKLILKLRRENVRLVKEQMEDDEPVFRKLNSGAAKYAVFSNKDVGNALSRRLELDNIRYAGRYKCVAYYVGITKSHEKDGVIKRVDDALHRMETEGLKRRLLAPYGIGYCGDKAPVAPPQPPQSPAPGPVAECVQETVNEDKVVRCKDTCLTWQWSGSEKEMNWHEAKAVYLDALNRAAFAGIRDWRLPSRAELETILAKDVTRETRMFLNGVFDSRSTDVWTDTRDVSSGRADVFYVDFYNGVVLSKSATDTNYVRAVNGTLCR